MRPGKVPWDWWNANNVYGVYFKSGVNTETYKYYIDFAAKYGLEYLVLDEGWSKTDDLLTLNPDINLPELLDYAKKKNVGIVLQSYLRRTAADVEYANRLGCRVRICKGAYQEPASVAFPEKRDVDENYVRCMQALMSDGNYPGVATHDERIIAQARRFAAEQKISTDRFEFQMLYGVRRDLQERLVRDGYRMRVYVPFGTQWYPYLMRRLAERPANVAFITGSVMAEMAGRRKR